jgi:hypothetical protein
LNPSDPFHGLSEIYVNNLDKPVWKHLDDCYFPVTRKDLSIPWGDIPSLSIPKTPDEEWEDYFYRLWEAHDYIEKHGIRFEKSECGYTILDIYTPLIEEAVTKVLMGIPVEIPITFFQFIF